MGKCYYQKIAARNKARKAKHGKTPWNKDKVNTGAIYHPGKKPFDWRNSRLNPLNWFNRNKPGYIR
jgi:hypothetical protein